MVTFGCGSRSTGNRSVIDTFRSRHLPFAELPMEAPVRTY